jgi:hypothetical protein
MPKRSRQARTNGKHTSLDRKYQRLLENLKKQAGVSKVVLGVARSCRHAFAPGNFKYMSETLSGFRANLYTDWGIQEIFVCLKQGADRGKIINYFELLKK